MNAALSDLGLWTKDLIIGDSLLDYEHQMIFSLIENCIHLSCNGGTRTQLVALLRIVESYLDYHFSSEEKRMSEGGDANLEQHLNQHEYLLRKLKQEIREIEQGKRSVTAQKVAYDLHDWYQNHLQLEDRKLVH